MVARKETPTDLASRRRWSSHHLGAVEGLGLSAYGHLRSATAITAGVKLAVAISVLFSLLGALSSGLLKGRAKARSMEPATANFTAWNTTGEEAPCPRR